MKIGRTRSSDTDGSGARRRPLPGATPQRAPAFSYYARRDQRLGVTGRQQPAQAPARSAPTRSWYERLGALLLAVLVLVCAVRLLSLSPSPRIITLNSSGQYFLHPAATYQQAAQQLLGASIWNRNKLTVNTQAVSNALEHQFPELASASITLPLASSRPVVYLAPVQPAFILSNGQDSFIIGSNGRALLPATTVPAGTKLDLPIVTDRSGLPIRLSQPALSSAQVAFIRHVVLQLKGHGVGIGALTLPADTSELDVQPTGQPYIVKFNMHTTSADQQAGTFLAVKHKLESQHITPTHYIDVRVDGRAYYR